MVLNRPRLQAGLEREPLAQPSSGPQIDKPDARSAIPPMERNICEALGTKFKAAIGASRAASAARKRSA